MIGKKINQLATELAPVSTDLTIIGDPVSGVSKKITLAQLGAIFSGAVSFYTNLAAFPVVGDINVIYCAKDTQKLYLWSGSAYTEVFPSQALLDTYQLRSEKGVSNGYASLDSGGKVPISQLPSSIMEYKGTWNAATNTPTLANGTGDTGDVYICNVAGTVDFGAGPLTFAVGDYVIYSGSIWQRSSGAVGTVTSVAVSRSGDALAITGSPITTSGTINLGFAGNSTQYINGAGNLVTFPGVINEAQNLITEVYNKTGATLTKGTVVYINGGQGNLPTITKALATGDSTSAQTYGIVRNDITNNNNGYVVVAGRISDLDTQAYTEGTQLYLSPTTAGTYTSTKPYAPNHLVYVGIVVRAHPTQGVVEVKIQNGYEMDELHNVAAQTPSNNDGLFWEASTSLWKNKSIATILGGTPITGSGNVNAIPKFTANSVLGNSVMEDDGNFVSMRGLKLNASAGVGNTINFQQASGITAAGLGYSTIGAAGSTGIQFYLDQNVTERIFIFDTATITSNTARTYSMPDSSGTLALVSQLTGGTVTSVGLSSATSGVTIGSTPITTSGTITLAIATASGSQQGLLSSTDWTTFNNKQNALTNPVTGTGTTNYLPKFTGTSTIGNSIMSEGSGVINIGTTASTTYGTLNVIQNSIASPNWVRGIQIVHPNGTGATGGYVSISNIGQKLGGIQVGDDAAVGNLVINPVGGNLGLGVTPSAWGAATTPALQVTSAALFNLTSGGNRTYFTSNAFFNGTNFIYLNSTSANMYLQYDGSHQWHQAPSGTAGNAISFTQAMTLDASANLMVGTTTAIGKVTFQQSTDSTVGGLAIVSVDGNGAVISRLNDGGLTFRNGGAERFRIASTGAATFSSSVEIGQSATVRGFTGTTGAGMFMAYGSAGAGVGSIYSYNYGTSTYGGTVIDGSYVAFYNSGSEAMRITGANVGIGTTSPSNKLVVSNGGAYGFEFDAAGETLLTYNRSTSAYATFNVNALQHTFQTSGSERMRITSGGNVGIATTAPKGKLGIGDQTKMVETTGITLGTGDGVIEFIGSQFGLGYGMKIWQSGERTLSIAGRAGSGVFTNYFTVFDTGKINMSNLPTSSAGLSSGDIYVAAGVLMIV